MEYINSNNDALENIDRVVNGNEQLSKVQETGVASI